MEIMHMPDKMMDIINCIFEGSAILVTYLNIKKILKDKHTSGITVVSQVFYFAWAIWNVYFYYEWHTFYSLWVSIFLAFANIIWLILVLYYKYLYKRNGIKYRPDELKAFLRQKLKKD
jgi:hypothetical protein